ncbi:hypothetical protein GCM10009789_20050 [Kribbella sancticallisti]|uniref:Uncharacterized protein n=1 Tax=Kribbella sancticallisti TaxID=460087 RepID=A0ABP4NU63_9ACTN
MTINTGRGAERGGGRAAGTDDRGWPILHAADPCDGRNPATGRPCERSYHQGHHRDLAGAEWLDDE